MTTSSGQKGFCPECDHALDQHTEFRDSKCLKCKKVFRICQAGSHGYSSGTGSGSGATGNHVGSRLCSVPCWCGPTYYPDAARSARGLEPHEYHLDHPAFRPVEGDVEGRADSTTYEYSTAGDESIYDEATGATRYDVAGLDSALTPAMESMSLVHDTHAAAVGSSSGKRRVDRKREDRKREDKKGEGAQQGTGAKDEEVIMVITYLNKNGVLCFQNDKQQEIKAIRSEWKESLMDDGTVESYWWQSKKSGRWFTTYELAEAEEVSPKKTKKARK